jgi:hypothetical protein
MVCMCGRAMGKAASGNSVPLSTCTIMHMEHQFKAVLHKDSKARGTIATVYLKTKFVLGLLRI